MRTYFLHICGLQPEIIPKVREMIQDKTQKENILNWAEKKIAYNIADYLADNPDKDDICWSIDDAIMSDDFFSLVNPDESLHFSQRIPIEYCHENIFLPNGKWLTKEIDLFYMEKILEQYRNGYLFIFFNIDF